MLAATAMVAELLLALGGVQPVAYNEDPYVGFSSYFPLFVTQEKSDGKVTMVTAKNKLRTFQAEAFPVPKPVGTYRIFCMGGSTTYGKPYGDTTSFCGWLRAMLPAIDSSRSWEVINAGGISYASYRVALLMEELIRYQPDLFIIYTGQNEFLERRSYSQIAETPRAVRGLGALLSRTRTYAGMRRLVDALRPPANRRDAGGSDLPAEVETILQHSVGPEAYHRDSALQKAVLAHMRFNLARMVDIARSASAEVVLVTPASNLRDCTPFKSEHREGLSDDNRSAWQAFFRQAQQAHARGQEAEALEAVDRTIAIDDQYAHAHFLRGRILWTLARYDDAKAAFARARDEDVCPLRALTPIRRIVLDVAGQRDVPVVDFVDLAGRLSEHGVPGDDLFLDHVHPTIEGNRQLAIALIDRIEQQGEVHPTADWKDGPLQQVTDKVLGGIDDRAHGVALRNLSRLLHWAGKYDDAKRLAQRAADLAPSDAEAHYQAGVYATEHGQFDRAIRENRKALELEPQHAGAHNHLGIALAAKGEWEEAVHHYRQALKLEPEDANVHYNLGNALVQQRKMETAIQHFQKAVQLQKNIKKRVRGYDTLGNALAVDGRLEEAEAAFRHAIELDTNHVESRAHLAGLLASRGRNDESRQFFRQAIALDPRRVDVRQQLATLLEKQGELDQALGERRAIVRLKPDSPDAHVDLAITLTQQGQRSEAIDHFRQAVRLAPGDANAHINLATMLAAEGETDQAVDHFRQAIQLKPQSPVAHYRLGRLLASRGDPRAGIEHLRQAVAVKPDWPEGLRAAAWLLATESDPELRAAQQAVEMAERAATLTQEKNPVVLDTLAAAYASSEAYQRAVTTAELALELARASHQDKLVQAIEQRRDLYQQGKPFVRPGPNAP
ncbi:MAG: tetratricopeptide repeat protein [Pirellulales bacterium]